MQDGLNLLKRLWKVRNTENNWTGRAIQLVINRRKCSVLRRISNHVPGGDAAAVYVAWASIGNTNGAVATGPGMAILSIRSEIYP